MSGFLGGLRERDAATAPGHVDPRLRGRTYSIPFDAVWRAALSLGDGGIRGWTTVRTDDQSGLLDLLVQPGLGPHSRHVDVRVTIGLDHNAQTRVDMTAVSRTERGDLGRARRLVHLFMTGLDRKLEGERGSILDPGAVDAWVAAHSTAPPERS